MQHVGGTQHMAGGALAALLLVLGACKAPPPKAAAPRCGPKVYGVGPLDALMVPMAPFEGAPIFVRDVMAMDSTGALSTLTGRLRAAQEADLTGVSAASRVALQNDVWGVLQRLQRAGVSSERVVQAEAAAAALVRRLALPPGTLRWTLAQGLPPGAPSSLLGLKEHGSELVSLQHERLYGNRRMFRIFIDGPRRALLSQLVAIDTQGEAYLTSVIGEVERLELSGDAVVTAAVHHLDRRGLRCGTGLKSVKEVLHIPAEGAHAFLAHFDTPQLLSDLPCTECHRSAMMMSLPDADSSAQARIDDIIKDLPPLVVGAER